MSTLSTLSSRRVRIDAVFSRVARIPVDDLQLQSDFASYLCVLVSGYVETAVSTLAIDHCRNRSSPTVTNFVEGRLSRIGVLNAERLLQFVGRFNIEWRHDLEQFMAGERRAALDSIAANRNQIAHGQSVGLTYSRVRIYYLSVCQIVDFLRERFS